jgi:hypothetical protein
MRHAELRERVCEASRGLPAAGLAVLSFGNASGIDRGQPERDPRSVA